MFSRIRRHASYGNVIAVIALVFAMTGGAYAAKKYVITSTSQIKPSVLKSLQSKVGRVGAAGAVGAQGPQGPAGLAGAAGAKGDNGTAGKSGENGAPGPKGATGAKGAEGELGPKGPTGSAGTSGTTGPAGTTGPEGVCTKANCTLPSGATETGTWSTTLYGLPKGKFPAAIAISFPVPLKEASPEEEEHAFFFTEEETSEIDNKVKVGAGGCNGTVTAPTAPAGVLCVYTEEESSGATSKFSFIVSPGAGLGQFAKTGTIVNLEDKAESSHMEARGTWAVTAP